MLSKRMIHRLKVSSAVYVQILILYCKCCIWIVAPEDTQSLRECQFNDTRKKYSMHTSSKNDFECCIFGLINSVSCKYILTFKNMEMS